jgi:uncharacterized tellurite resistance protein B-like protein
MFERLKALLQHTADAHHAVDEEQAVPLAAAMLLLEVAWADQKITDAEMEATRRAIQSLFGLAAEDVERLVQRARAEHETTISMYPFTRAANDALSMDEKKQLIEALWRLASTDEDSGGHEEYTIRRISDLLYVSHDDFIAAKLAARSG